MNRRRIAALLRELADEFERDDAPANDAAPPVPRTRRTEPLPPPQPPTDVDVARARRALSKRGYR